mmetsp:Transcript_17114/g.25656  ORF Transcript_17114/g.25656 Transcript_17114/m.25656 type:complete len:281 (+) Transcript_17114:1513-2355(+)
MKYFFTLGIFQSPIMSIDISGDSKYLVGGSLNSFIYVWNLNSGKLYNSLKQSHLPISSVLFIGDMNNILYCCMDRWIYLRNFNLQKLLFTFSNFSHGIVRLFYSPKLDVFISISVENHMRKWSNCIGMTSMTLKNHDHKNPQKSVPKLRKLSIAKYINKIFSKEHRSSVSFNIPMNYVLRYIRKICRKHSLKSFRKIFHNMSGKIQLVFVTTLIKWLVIIPDIHFLLLVVIEILDIYRHKTFINPFIFVLFVKLNIIVSELIYSTLRLSLFNIFHLSTLL